VAALLRGASAHDMTLTFRSGGTSLSGQATNDGVLVDVRRHFRDIEVLDDGARLRVQPGATVRSVNTRLARYGRKLGPDPASESACTIGGVIANNSSGMACGTEFNASVETIRRLYSIKNTMGYGVNAFIDHTRPIDILTHLVIGSEGTLAFVAEATFHTVPAHPHAATGLLLFPDLAAATGALPHLAEDFATVELLDATSLRVAQRDPQATADLRELAVRDHAALLVEHQQPTADALAGKTPTRRGCSVPCHWPPPPGSARTPTPAPPSGTSARASTPQWPEPARRARLRCWRTSQSPSTACCRCARRAPKA
jgi:D-lactate dehydrogenase